MKMCTEIKKNKIKKISVHTVSAENYNCFSLYKSLRLLGYCKMKLFDQASDIFFRIFKLVCNLGKSFSFLEFFLNEIASFPFFALPNTFFKSFLFSRRNCVPAGYVLLRHIRKCTRFSPPLDFSQEMILKSLRGYIL